MTGPPPQLSVLMPVRDGARWIGASIDSVLAQTFADIELLIVDDGSSDTTPAIIASYAARDSRIRVVTQAPAGLVRALNTGISAARAPLIARLDADDIAEPARFAEQIARMAQDPRLALLGSWAIEIDGTGAVVGERRPSGDPARLKRALARGNPFIHSSIMMRTALVREIGGYRETFAAAEDYDLWLRLAERGEIANIERPLLRYRVHGGSVSARKTLLQMFSTRLAKRSALLRRAGQPDPADGLDAPPDPWSMPPQGYAADVAIYRWLAWSDPDTLPAAHRDDTPDLTPLTRTALSRRERRLAQDAILRYSAAHPDRASGTMLWRVFTLRPLRALPLLWRHARHADSPEFR